jgi:hypothetical protein
VGLLLFVFGVLADLIAANRRLSQETLYRLRKLEMTVQEPSIEIEHVLREAREFGDSELEDS